MPREKSDGEATRWKWQTVWMPEEEAYVRGQDPIGRADVVIDGSDPHVYEQSPVNTGRRAWTRATR
jgi:hypothetical protein